MQKLHKEGELENINIYEFVWLYMNATNANIRAIWTLLIYWNKILKCLHLNVSLLIFSKFSSSNDQIMEILLLLWINICLLAVDLWKSKYIVWNNNCVHVKYHHWYIFDILIDKHILENSFFFEKNQQFP